MFLGWIRNNYKYLICHKVDAPKQLVCAAVKLKEAYSYILSNTLGSWWWGSVRVCVIPLAIRLTNSLF